MKHTDKDAAREAAIEKIINHKHEFDISVLGSSKTPCRVCGLTARECVIRRGGIIVGYDAGLSARPQVSRAAAIYVASRASVPERGIMWRAFRDQGCPIISSWIDEDGDGQTESFADLWTRIVAEVSKATRLVLYAETGDFPLKGALIEIGAALGLGIPVIVCLPGVDVAERSCRPIGSWINHPLVIRCDDIGEAMAYKPAPMSAEVSEGDGGEIK